MKIKIKKSLIYKDTTQHTCQKKFEHSTNVMYRQLKYLFSFVRTLNLYPFKL